MHNFLTNGNRPASSDSNDFSYNSKTSSDIWDSSKQIFLTAKESIASASLQWVDVTGINVNDIRLQVDV